MSPVLLMNEKPFNSKEAHEVEAFGPVSTIMPYKNLDEAIALPTDFSARIARNTQLYIQKETKVTDVVDPLGGSYYVESLTGELIQKAREIIHEIESQGGMTSMIERGIPKLRIEEAAAAKQARIDSGEEIIVGVNQYKSGDKVDFPILEVDNGAVRAEQIYRLKQIRDSRNETAVKNILDAITACAQSGDGNLLALAVEAARMRCTLGEISMAMEEIFGRHSAKTLTISGVYSGRMKNQNEVEEVRKLSDRFAEQDGRRPRILVAKMGQDGHDRGSKIIATGFADLGFDVDIGPLFLTPAEVAKQAIENDVHIVGASSLAGGLCLVTTPAGSLALGSSVICPSCKPLVSKILLASSKLKPSKSGISISSSPTPLPTTKSMLVPTCMSSFSLMGLPFIS